MEKQRKIVNARKFVSDVRSGLNDAELMAAHDLDSKSLKRLWALLVEKGLLIPRKKPIRGAAPSAGASGPPDASTGEPDVQASEGRPVMVDKSISPCPQCGAPVGGKALICPECGHVLPGQERWERVGPKKTLVERIPPWFLGLVISAPFALVIFIMFQHFFIPATEKRIERQQRPANSGATDAPRSVAAPEPPNPDAPIPENADLPTLILRLTEMEIILEHSTDYLIFTSGNHWGALTPDRRREALVRLQSRLKEEKSVEEFLVIDSAGFLKARVFIGGMEITEEDTPSPSPDDAPPDKHQDE